MSHYILPDDHSIDGARAESLFRTMYIIVRNTCVQVYATGRNASCSPAARVSPDGWRVLENNKWIIIDVVVHRSH